MVPSENSFLCPCGLRATAARLLPASLRDLLNDLIVDVSVGYQDAAAAIAELDGDRRTLLVVGDLLGGEVTDEDGLTSHVAPFSFGWARGAATMRGSNFLFRDAWRSFSDVETRLE